MSHLSSLVVPVPGLLAGAVIEGFLDRLAECFRAFWFLLTHDTTGMTERAVLAPYFLATWLVAGLVASPLSMLVLRAMGHRIELPRVVGVNFGIVVTQLALFGVNWGVIGWGQRTIDQAVFAASLVPATVIALWGLDLSLPKAFVHAVTFALFALGTIFLGVFAATEFGLLKL